jgi:chaperonin GroEL (HSP60 family)
LHSRIVDPAKVTRLAIQNVASRTGLILTFAALVAEIPEKKTLPLSLAQNMS